MKNPVKRKGRVSALVKWQDLVLRVGMMMSNVCFNLSQLDNRELTQRDRQCLRDLWEMWDEVMAERPRKRP